MKVGLIVWALPVLALLSRATPVAADVLVQDLAAGSALLRAGVEPGDRFGSWRRPDGEAEPLRTAFDWLWLETEQAPRGPLRLDGKRRGEPFSVRIEPGLWQARVRPELPGDLLAVYRSGSNRLDAGDAVGAADRWHRAAAGSALPRHVRTWLLYRAGSVLVEAGETAAGEELLTAALEAAEAPRERLAILRALAIVHRSAGRLDAAEEAFHEMSALWHGESPGGLGEADVWSQLSEVAEARGDLDAVDRWLVLAADRLDALAPVSVDRAKIWAARGRQAYSRGLYDEAEAAHRRAADMFFELAPESARMAVGWMNLGMVPAVRGDLQEAERYHRRAWELFERLDPHSLNAAACLNNLGAIAMQRGDPPAAEEFMLQALEIRERLAGGSVAVAGNLSNLGIIARSRGDLERASDYYHRALVILQQQAPQSTRVANTLTNLGNLANEKGDLAEAEDFYRRALVPHQKLAPASIGTALLMMNLGSVARQRGDFAHAESWYRRGLEILRRAAPEGEKMATLEAGLGTVLMERWDLEKAEEHLARALGSSRRRAPGSLEEAGRWNLLGTLARMRGDLDTAAAHQERALAVQRLAAPDGLQQTRSLVNLGELALLRGEIVASRRYAERALRLLEPRAPESAAAAAARVVLGEAELAAGDLEGAERSLSDALEVLEGRGFAGYRRVECLEALARVARRQGRPELAWGHLERALEDLDEQVGKLGGGRDEDGSFRARYGHVYRAAIDLLLELGRPSAAFEVLEERRARGLLSMLAERDLAFVEIPVELSKARRRLAVLYDRSLQELLEADGDAERAEELGAELDRLRRARRELQDRIRESAPQIRELEDARTASSAEIRAALDPGTLLLSYSVGEAVTRLFVLSRESGLQVFEVPIGEGRLRSAVRGLVRLIEQRRNPGSPAYRALLLAAHELYEVLLGPARHLVEASERLLVVPDGPLFRVPFAALVDAPPSGEWRFLVEERGLHVVASATLYTQLRGRRGERDRPRELVAFGDPDYGEARPGTAPREPQVRSAARYFDLRPLPGSRLEVEKIGGLYPRGSQLWLGRHATEERAKNLDRETRYVHFAAHGLLNERSPLDSAIALTLATPEADGENGLLQVWEIFEQVRIDADLVVLSACQTASGPYVDGEGLIGLARAFHYAGASSVLASSWKVEDRATADLMFRFYRNLRAGSRKDAALRSAQLGLLRSSEHAAPYYWASFQLYGDR
ncbi:MAG: CHAT domain-containing protein [Holophagales bacterium]|nr:CHAT domain-containing protein [Holophagales bacterium]